MIVRLVVAVVVALVACASCRERAHEDVAVHRERARSILEVHCGLCHLPPEIGGGTGMALHIYDLSAPDWSATLSDAQLPIVEQKLHDDGADDDEMRALDRFIADEIAWRDAHPSTYSQEMRARPPRGL